MWTGFHVWRKEEQGSPLMVTLTSTWCWSPTSPVQEMFMQFRSKDPEQDGNQCQEIGDKTGKVTLTLTVKAYPFKSPPVTVELWQATTWCLLVGSLARPLKEANFKAYYYFFKYIYSYMSSLVVLWSWGG